MEMELKGLQTYDPYKLTEQSEKFNNVYVLDQEEALDQAEDLGLDVREADDHTLQLDFDDDKSYGTFLSERLANLLSFVNVTRVYRTASKSGNKHVYIKLEHAMPVMQRIALQAALGSDPVRELISVMRVRNNSDKPVLLFEKPDTAEVLMYQNEWV